MKTLILDVAARELVKNVLAVSKLYSYRREYVTLNTDLLNTTTETASYLGEINHVRGAVQEDYILKAIRGLNKIKLLVSVFTDEGLFSTNKAVPLCDFCDTILASVKMLLKKPLQAVPVSAMTRMPSPVQANNSDDDGLNDLYMG